MIKAKLFGFLSLVFALAFGQGALAQELTDRVAVYDDWGVYEVKDPKTCWVGSLPIPDKTRNTKNGQKVNVRRGDTLLYVTFTLSEGLVGVVSFTGGYTFDEKTKVTVVIDDQSFGLGAINEWAWIPPGAEGAILTAMKQGAFAVITGLSDKGTLTEDTFSLKGFTASVEDAEARCK